MSDPARPPRSRAGSLKYILVVAVLAMGGLPDGHLRTFAISLVSMGLLASVMWSGASWKKYWWLPVVGSALTTFLQAQYEAGAISIGTFAAIVVGAIAAIGYAFVGGGRGQRRREQEELSRRM
jgi:hypothetical protein